jgi:SAM-dependent methyltransferase
MTDYLTRQLQDMAPHRAILRAVECKFMGRVPLTPPVLDIGCGDGHFASIAYTQLPIDVGVDVMERDLPEAAARPGVYRKVMYASATRLPFDDAAFNTVISNCVIEHIPDNAAVLAEISRVLRPGGVFATTLPSEHYPEYLLGATAFRRIGLKGLARRYGDFFNRISHHYHVYPPEEWRGRLKAAGLIVEEQAYYFSPAAHRRFDLSHYLGVPNLVSKRLLGRWVLFDAQRRVFERWLRPYYEEPLPETGAYQFVLCRKPFSAAVDVQEAKHRAGGRAVAGAAAGRAADDGGRPAGTA